MRASLVIALSFFSTASAFAAEDGGCDKFKWDVARDRAALTTPNLATLASGGEIDTTGKAVTLTLKPAEGNLPVPPERKPPAETFAGFVSLKAPAQTAVYTISLSAAAWVDVVQDGNYLKPRDNSGVRGCDGIRKSMKYEIAAKPFVIQMSGVKAETVNIIASPSQ
jgi:hypothetical protein